LRTGTRDGRRLEDVVGGKALAAHATRLLGRADVTGLFAATTVDSRAAAVCREFVDELAFHLANLAVALDPERVVVGGGLVRAWQHLQPPLAAALAQTVPYPPELVMAAHPYDAPLLGALALAGAAGPALSPVAAALSEGAPA
jgi:glucokinase